MDTNKTGDIELKYPSRLRLFLGFLVIAFASLVDKRNSAELLALGLDAKRKIDLKRAKDRMMSNTRKVTRQLKITGCNDAQKWYSDMIGKTIPFVREIDDYFLSLEPSGYVNIVKKKDAEIIYT